MNIFSSSLPAPRSRVEAFVPLNPRARSEATRPYLVSTRRQATPQQRALPLFPHEPEDARLTGSTRSLFRRLLALNLPGSSIHIEVTSETVIKKPSVSPYVFSNDMGTRTA